MSVFRSALLFLLGAALAAAESAADSTALLSRAGNTDDESVRRAAVAELAALPAANAPRRADAAKLAGFVRERNAGALKLYYALFRGQPKQVGVRYDFGFSVGSPLAPLADLYLGRIIAWNLIEDSTGRSSPELGRLYDESALAAFRPCAAAFTQNRTARMHLGEAVPWPKSPAPVAGAAGRGVRGAGFAEFVSRTARARRFLFAMGTRHSRRVSSAVSTARIGRRRGPRPAAGGKFELDFPLATASNSPMRLPHRSWFVVAALMAWCVPTVVVLAAAPSAVGSYELRVTADRAGQIYRRGEKVTFTVSLLREGTAVAGPDAKWSITKDGVPLGREGSAPIPEGGLALAASLGEPGFLHCLVECTPPATPKLTARAGAAIDPLAIAPSLPAPADFDAFWAAQKKLLAATPANLRLTPVKSPAAGVECFEVQADTGVGRGLSGYLVRPVGAREKALPAIVLAHGSGVTTSRLPIGVKWAQDGFLALDFNANGLPNAQPREFYAALQAGELKEYYLQGRESRDTIYLRGIFFRLLRALDTLAAQPEWDGRRLVALGRSQGGGQAIAAGALDPRVTYVSAEIPTFCDHTGIAAGRINGWPRLIPNGTVQPDPRVVEAVRYYDAVSFAPRIRAQVFFTVGFIDHICPPTGIYAAFNQLVSRKDIWQHLDTGHVSRPDYEARVRDEVLAYLRSAQSP